MNKQEALKIAKEVNGEANFRHYDNGSWAIELADGIVVHTVEAWEERKIQTVLQAQADADMFAAYEDDGQ